MNKGGHPDNAKVKITKQSVLKTYNKESHKAYANELFFYLLSKKHKLNFIPDLISYDLLKRNIKTKNVGVALDQYCSDNEIDIDTFIPDIKKIYNKLLSYGFFHNDLRYKNIVINPSNKKLYLIDFEFSGPKYTDLDDQNIVKKITKKNDSGSKSKKKSKKK